MITKDIEIYVIFVKKSAMVANFCRILV